VRGVGKMVTRIHRRRKRVHFLVRATSVSQEQEAKPRPVEHEKRRAMGRE